MLKLLYLLCVFYIFWRIFRWLFAIGSRWFIRRHAERMYTNFFGQQPPRGNSPRYGQKAEDKQPKKKVFDKTDGEYVEFTDIEETEISSDEKTRQTNVSYKKEEQITDAEWHDI
ncbi:DUF4834 family protein [uncultured Muribaculum sp.]|uniref:DUF4834 family protein n=1 Tax=uncultured Muribaculum sp. TaxID=1918613 RepID=UPI0025B0C222|nr:DUF4834 family protein [uncultured Muribaculum sp.]